MSGQRRPTLRDVAAEAGVSFKTVSRVINREGGVSDELVSRVERAVDTLGYRPDQRARLLRRTSTEATTIGFVLVDVGNPFFSSILRGIEEVATIRRCLVLAGSTGASAKQERRLVDALVERRVAGLIVAAGGAASTELQSEMARGTPMVFLDLEPDFDGVDLVRSDHRAGAVNATRHLLDHGHTDIAYFGDDLSYFSARLRLDGFRAALADAGLAAPQDRVVVGSHGLQWTARVADYFASHSHPTAIFTAQNFATIGAVRALHRLGLRHTVAHVGFDDLDLADALTPGLSVIPQHPRDLGRRAAELLFARLDGDTGPPVRDVIESRLIERGSGEIRPQEADIHRPV